MYTQLSAAVGFSLVSQPSLSPVLGPMKQIDYKLFTIGDAVAAWPLLGGLLHLKMCAIILLTLVGRAGEC